MECVPAQVRIEFLLFNPALLELLVARGHIAGDRLVFAPRFSAFQNNVFSRHQKK
jgi:hypothetical protein